MVNKFNDHLKSLYPTHTGGCVYELKLGDSPGNMILSPKEGADDNLKLAQGYSMFLLMKPTDMFKDGNAQLKWRGKADEKSPNYKFSLSKEQYTKLSEAITAFDKARDDFSQTHAMLLGDDSYIGTGRKSIKELKTNSTVLKNLCSQQVINQMTGKTDGSMEGLDKNIEIVLPFTMNLDINEHPEKNDVKKLYEDLFKEYKLMDTDNNDKTFMKETGNGFSVNLRPEELNHRHPNSRDDNSPMNLGFQALVFSKKCLEGFWIESILCVRSRTRDLWY